MAAITINSSPTSNYLNFINNGSTTPVVNLNANKGVGTSLFAYAVYPNIALANDTTIQGDGTAIFSFTVPLAVVEGLSRPAPARCISRAPTLIRALPLSATARFRSPITPSVQANIVFNGGTLQWASGNTQDISGCFASIASGKVATIDTNGNYVSFASPLSGDGGLTKAGTGTLTLTGSNTYTGTTTISAGTLSFAAGSLDSTSAITFNGGTLQWATGNTQDISSRFTAIASGKVATIDTNGNNISFASALSGEGGLAKVGTGTLTLTGAHTYSGNTTISAGTANWRR